MLPTGRGAASNCGSSALSTTRSQPRRARASRAQSRSGASGAASAINRRSRSLPPRRRARPTRPAVRLAGSEAETHQTSRRGHRDLPRREHNASAVADLPTPPIPASTCTRPDRPTAARRSAASTGSRPRTPATGRRPTGGAIPAPDTGPPVPNTGPAGPDTGTAGPDTGPAGPDTGTAGPDTGPAGPDAGPGRRSGGGSGGGGPPPGAVAPPCARASFPTISSASSSGVVVRRSMCPMVGRRPGTSVSSNRAGSRYTCESRNALACALFRSWFVHNFCT